jgi:hypothetical protein
MTMSDLDLDDMERKAKAATPDDDWRDFLAAANPAAVLALIERVRELEGDKELAKWIGLTFEAHDRSDRTELALRNLSARLARAVELLTEAYTGVCQTGVMRNSFTKDIAAFLREVWR